MKKKVGLVLYPGCIFFELSLCLELIADDFEVVAFTPNGDDLLLNNKITTTGNFSYSSYKQESLDALLIPGGDAESIFNNKDIDELLKHYWKEEIVIGAICFGPVLLAKAGVLSGITISHGLEDEQKNFLKNILEGVNLVDDPFTHDKNLITAKPWAHIDFAVEFANKLGVIPDKKMPHVKSYYKGSPEGRIRPLALGIIENNQGQFLFHEGYDSVKNEYFYRPLGGGIEFGETATLTIVREFQEELGVEIEVGESLGFYENIFQYEGKGGHEFVVIHRANFKDEKLNNRDYFDIEEAGRVLGKAVWRSVEEIKSQGAKLYPLGIEEKICE